MIFNRRDFLGTLAATSSGSLFLPEIHAEELAQTPRKKLAVITTEWRYHSHAWHMAERFAWP